eukprot:gene18156-19967_t
MDTGLVSDANKDFDSLINRAKEGSHYFVKSSPEEFQMKGPARTVKHISNVIDSLPVLGILSEIGLSQEENDQSEFREENQEAAINKQLNNMHQNLDLQDDMLVDICPKYFTTEFLAKLLVTFGKKTSIVDKDADTNLDAVKGIIKVTKKLVHQSKIDPCVLSRHVLSNLHVFSLHVIIEMADSQLISVKQWVCEFYKKSQLLDMKYQVVDYMKKPSSVENCSHSKLKKSMKFLLHMPMFNNVCSDYDKETRHSVNQAVCSIFEQLDFSQIFLDKHQCSTSSNDKFSLVLRISTETGDHHNNEKLQLFTLLLENMLKSGNNFIALEDTFVKHVDWLYQELDTRTTSVLQEMLLYLENDVILGAVKSSLKYSAVRFQRLLSLLSVWLICCEGAWKAVVELLRAQIDIAVEVRSEDYLKRCLLVARHCSLERLSGFPSYDDWFAEHIASLIGAFFTEERSLVGFYVNCLTSLLPVESKFFLNVQLSAVAKLQSLGKGIVSEYTNAGKTKISYTKDTRHDTNTNTKASSSMLSVQLSEFAVKDVEKAVCQYAATLKIPTGLLEVSVFRKSYFVGSFLPALLVPGLVKNDVNRQRFVEDLRKAGKIPSKVMHAYEQALEAYELEEVFCAADVKLDDLLEAVLKKVSELPGVAEVRRHAEEPKRRRIIMQSYLSSLSLHLRKLYDALNAGSTIESERYRFEGRVVSDILDNVCQVCATELSADNSSLKLLKSYMKMLGDHKGLQVMLEAKVLMLLRDELENLERYHLSGIACIIAACSNGCSEKNVGESIMESAVESVKRARTPFWLHKSLLFISDVFLFCNELYSDVIITSDEVIAITAISDSVIISDRVMKYFSLMLMRLKSMRIIMTNRSINDHDDSIKVISDAIALACSVEKLDAFKTYFSNNSILSADWLEFELALNPCFDLMSSFQKQDYYYHVINDMAATSTCSSDWMYLSVASKIVHVLLESGGVKTEPFKCADHCGTNWKYSQIIKTNQSSFNGMLSLLQSLNYKISFEGRHSDNLNALTSKWLLSAFEGWLKMAPSESGQFSTDRNNSSVDDTLVANKKVSTNQVSILCYILRSLPPATLFSTNCLSDLNSTSRNKRIYEVASFINDLAKFLLHGSCSFVLPCDLTECFVNAIISYCEFCSSSLGGRNNSGFDESVKRLLEASPVICVSIACHSKQDHIANRLEKCTSNELYCFKELLLLQQAISAETRFHGDASFSAQIIGICIFVLGSSIDGSLLRSNLVTVHRKETLQVVFDCFMIDLSKGLIEGTAMEKLPVALGIFKKIPGIALSVIEDVLENRDRLGLQDLRKIFTAGVCTLGMYPVAVLKVLALMDPLCLQNFACKPRGKDVIAKCIRRVESIVNDVTSEWPEALLLEPLSVAFLEDMERIAGRLKLIR